MSKTIASSAAGFGLVAEATQRFIAIENVCLKLRSVVPREDMPQLINELNYRFGQGEDVLDAIKDIYQRYIAEGC